MNLISPTELSRIIEKQSGEPFTRQAVHKAIDQGLIPFTLSGKKKMIDLNNPAIKHYISDNNRQREAVKKNESEKRQGKAVNKGKPSKLPVKNQGKSGKPSGLNDKKKPVKAVQSEQLEMFEIHQRIKKAKMDIEEMKVLTMQKKLFPADFIEYVFISHIEKLNSTIDRLASTAIQDIGNSILEAGEVKAEHIEKFNNIILEACFNTKKIIKKEKDKYEPQL